MWFLELLHVFPARCATPTALEESLFCDKRRGEGNSCLWHGSDVLICDPEADEQMLHCPLCALPELQQHMDMEIKAPGCHKGGDLHDEHRRSQASLAARERLCIIIILCWLTIRLQSSFDC